MISKISFATLGVWPPEKVAECLAPKQCTPPPAPMFRPVMDHVAPLAEGREVGAGIVRRVVIAMRCREYDPCASDPGQIVYRNRNTDQPAPTIAPLSCFRIPPTPISKVTHELPVGAAANLASTPGSAETDRYRQLAPIDRIEKAVLAPDGHGGGGEMT